MSGTKNLTIEIMSQFIVEVEKDFDTAELSMKEALYMAAEGYETDLFEAINVMDE